MSALETLGFTVGTAFASGLNLYATVAVLGLLERFRAIQLPESLHVIAHFSSQITVRYNEVEVNGKSILGLLLLAAPCGSELTITTEGDDAPEALSAIEALIGERFGEPE